jgi:RimJ/RimL family protein N-acetyltransferase
LDEQDKEAHCICGPYNKIDTIKQAVVTYKETSPVGCGAIREYSPTTMEIKRMYVLKNERKKGIASLILNELENWSKELDFKRCILETGQKMPEAIGLYEKKDYTRIPNYGQYEYFTRSICFEKDLTSIKIETARLQIIPLTIAQFLLLLEGTNQMEQALKLKPSGEYLDADTQEAMKALYEEALKHPDKYWWYTNWQIILKSENKAIGSACFMKEPDENHQVEIGYGMNEAYRNQGYMTEAVKAMCEWAFNQPDVKSVIAETNVGSPSSQRVLEKCGMRKYEQVGESIWWRLSEPC